ncbi:MAG: hypothetical protein HFJ10_01395 [Lachnospiraceae bacterium]|jgi:hypothetical protein|nr:hypothetical protein [Lachnospiraceae bacterium]
MKLNTSILANKLKSKFMFQMKKIVSDDLHLEHVLFYCDGDQMQSHKIYICTQKQVAEREMAVPEYTVLFCIGKVPIQNIEKGGQVFQLPEDTDPFQLFNAIQRLFDYYEQWDEKLHELATQEGSIQEMLDESFHIFHNPIIVNLADYFVISYSSIIDTRTELSSLVDPDAIFEYSREYRDTKLHQKLMKKKGAYFFPDYLTGARSLCVNIFERDRFTYRVTMVESLSRFETYDGVLLEHLSKYIKTALSKQMVLQTDMGYRLDRILSDILSNPEQDLKLLEQGFSEFGWLPSHHYFCITLKVAALDLENMTVRFICSHIENILGNASAFQHKNNITIFVNLTRFGGEIEDVMEKIVYFLRDSFLKAGLSNEFVGFEHIRYYYRQAVAALEVGNRRSPLRWIHRFDDIALDYLLEQSKGELSCEIVCSRKIMDLKRFDERHNTDYYHTLKLYVRNHLNAVQTAKLLYIHRSTFLYRMEKIKEITRLDLDDFDTLLYVMMTFRMLDQEGLE